MKRIKLVRFESDEYRTLGKMNLYIDDYIYYTLCTLELPWKLNEKCISCIPTGEYILKPIIRPNRKWALEFQDVANRSHILIHQGNYTSDIQGCVLVGMGFNDINNDGITDVISSATAIALLERYCKDIETIKIEVCEKTI